MRRRTVCAPSFESGQHPVALSRRPVHVAHGYVRLVKRGRRGEVRGRDAYGVWAERSRIGRRREGRVFSRTGRHRPSAPCQWHDRRCRLCHCEDRTSKAPSSQENTRPSAPTTSVAQAIGAANAEDIIHSFCSLSRSLPQPHTCPAVVGYSSMAATAAAINVTSS